MSKFGAMKQQRAEKAGAIGDSPDQATATVATRPWARADAVTPPAISICEITQPPKMSPAGLASAGIAKVRIASSPFGSAIVFFPKPQYLV